MGYRTPRQWQQEKKKNLLLAQLWVLIITARGVTRRGTGPTAVPASRLCVPRRSRIPWWSVTRPWNTSSPSASLKEMLPSHHPRPVYSFLQKIKQKKSLTWRRLPIVGIHSSILQNLGQEFTLIERHQCIHNACSHIRRSLLHSLLFCLENLILFASFQVLLHCWWGWEFSRGPSGFFTT